jgi:hypothetical protein
MRQSLNAGMFNSDFNYGEFALIKSQAGLDSYRIEEEQQQLGWDRPR